MGLTHSVPFWQEGRPRTGRPRRASRGDVRGFGSLRHTSIDDMGAYGKYETPATRRCYQKMRRGRSRRRLETAKACSSHRWIFLARISLQVRTIWCFVRDLRPSRIYGSCSMWRNKADLQGNVECASVAVFGLLSYGARRAAFGMSIGRWKTCAVPRLQGAFVLLLSHCAVPKLRNVMPALMTRTTLRL